MPGTNTIGISLGVAAYATGLRGGSSSADTEVEADDELHNEVEEEEEANKEIAEMAATPAAAIGQTPSRIPLICCSGVCVYE